MFQRFSVRLGTTSLAFNSLVLVTAAVLLSLERTLYTLVYIYVNSYMVNLVVTGLSQRKAVFIISQPWQEISREILEKLDRGLTVIKGQGGTWVSKSRSYVRSSPSGSYPHLKELFAGWIQMLLWL